MQSIQLPLVRSLAVYNSNSALPEITLMIGSLKQAFELQERSQNPQSHVPTHKGIESVREEDNKGGEASRLIEANQRLVHD